MTFGNEKLREAAKVYFQQLYTEEFPIRPKLDNLHFDTLGNARRELLEQDFSEDEIVVALKSIKINPLDLMTSISDLSKLFGLLSKMIYMIFLENFIIMVSLLNP